MQSRRTDPNSLEAHVRLTYLSWTPARPEECLCSPVGSPSQSDMVREERRGPGQRVLLPARCRALSVCRVTSWFPPGQIYSARLQASMQASLCFSPLTSLSLSFSYPSLDNLTSGCRTCPSNHALRHWTLNLDPTVIPWDSVSLIMAGLLDVVTQISHSWCWQMLS